MAVRNGLLGAVGVLLVAAYGCGDGPCRGSENRSVPLSEFPCAEFLESGRWASHPFPPDSVGECLWFDFQGCSTYTFENPFGSAAIAGPIGYLSFESDGEFASPGSGNSFVIDAVTDSEIVIRNAQNADFYLRLVVN